MTAVGDRYTLGVSENSGQGVAYNSRESTIATEPAEKKAKLMKMLTPAVCKTLGSHPMNESRH